jgi:tetratricopeptide (TPR) repeat protein
MIELLLQGERALSVGMLDQAERLYRQAVDADPRNAIAVVGLARVALERGAEGESIELGRRALEIDPENAAARRLVDRLVEVRAYREQAAGGPDAAAPEPPVPAPVAPESAAPESATPALAAPESAAPESATTAPAAPESAMPAPEAPAARRRGLFRRLLRRGP